MYFADIFGAILEQLHPTPPMSIQQPVLKVSVKYIEGSPNRLHTIFERSGSGTAKPRIATKVDRKLPPPATTPEGRDRQLISLAYDLAEQRLRDGTATSQEVCHFLKLATEREKLENERLRNENTLAQAKTKSLESQRRMDELYEKAIRAFTDYSGTPIEEDDYEDY